MERTAEPGDDQHKELLHAVLNNTVSSIMLLKPVRDKQSIIDFEYIYTNNQTLASVGRKHLTGKRFTQEFPGVRGSKLLAAYINVIETGRPYQEEVNIEPFGLPVWSQVYARKMDNLLLVTYFDITEKKVAAHQLADRYLQLFNAIDQGFCVIEFIWDARGDVADYRFVEANAAFQSQTGITDRKSEGMKAISFEAQKRWLDTFAKVARSQQPLHFEHEAMSLTEGWYEVNAFPISGSQVGILLNNITARKVQEEKQHFILKVSDTLRAVTDPLLIAETACRMIAKKLNATRVQYTLNEGEPGSEMGQVWGEYVGKGIPMPRRYPLAPFGEQNVALLRSGKTFILEDAATDSKLSDEQRKAFAAVESPAAISVPLIKDGRFDATFTVHDAQPRKWKNWEISLIEDLAERTWAAVERARAEEALRTAEEAYRLQLEREVHDRTAELEESRDQLRSILDTTLVQMSILQALRDENGQITDLEIRAVNHELEKETGRKDLVGKRYAEEYPGIKVAGLFDLIVKAIETGEPQAAEYFYEFEGFKKWFSCVFVKLHDGVVATNMDISMRKAAEEQLRKLDADRKREIFEVSLSSLEEERQRISESLHNGIAQMLYGIKIALSAIKHQMPLEKFNETRDYASSLLTEAIIETRRISHELMPTTLDQFGLKSAINDICRQLNDGTHFSCEVIGWYKRIEKYLELAIYRTVQELMNNVVKHAQATQCRVTVNISALEIEIRVSDNGKGMESEQRRKPGIGLASIRSKIGLLNGHVHIDSNCGKGTNVAVVIPIPQQK